MNQTPDHVPNPRRVTAGRANRLKRGTLTSSGRTRLRIAALENKPWMHSTGPRSEEGCEQAASNGRVRQTGLISTRESRKKLAEVRVLIGKIQDACRRLRDS